MNKKIKNKPENNPENPLKIRYFGEKWQSSIHDTLFNFACVAETDSARQAKWRVNFLDFFSILCTNI